MISANIGRRSLYGLILFGFAGAFLALWIRSRGGAATFESTKPIIGHLLAHYVPLLGILVGFYFSEKNTAVEAAPVSLDTFLLAVVLVGIWTLTPPVLLGASETGAAAIRLLESIAVLGSSLASACLAYFFSRTSSQRRAYSPCQGSTPILK